MTELTTEQKADIQRLSDAMRAGAAIRPQATGVLFKRREGSELVCSCALGAAWEGSHPAFNVDHWISQVDSQQVAITLVDIMREFRMFGLQVENPVSQTIYDIDGVIVDLNDQHDWTREDIADWLLTLV
jgi:hypothetical protein